MSWLSSSLVPHEKDVRQLYWTNHLTTQDGLYMHRDYKMTSSMQAETDLPYKHLADGRWVGQITAMVMNNGLIL